MIASEPTPLSLQTVLQFPLRTVHRRSIEPASNGRRADLGQRRDGCIDSRVYWVVFVARGFETLKENHKVLSYASLPLYQHISYHITSFTPLTLTHSFHAFLVVIDRSNVDLHRGYLVSRPLALYSDWLSTN